MKGNFLKGFKGKKHATTAVCLALGAVMVTSAAYAGYDDAKGYSNYKEAIKDLAFYNENFTSNAKISMLIDGKAVNVMDTDFMLDGENFSVKTEATAYGNNESSTDVFEEVYYGGRVYNKDEERKEYTVYESREEIRPDIKDPAVKKAVRFIELVTDSLVGDVKNNFVLTGKDGDSRNYSVKLSGNQIPELLNVGLSLMFVENTGEESGMVTYEDYDKTFGGFYKEKTGKELDWDNWDEKDEEVFEEFGEKYGAVLEKNNGKGIVHVYADGSHKFYVSYEEYRNENYNGVTGSELLNMLGSEPYVSDAVCNFTLDKEGRLTENDIEVTMKGTDIDGKKHAITLKIELEASNYGKTKVEKFDTTGLKKIN